MTEKPIRMDLNKIGICLTKQEIQSQAAPAGISVPQFQKCPRFIFPLHCPKCFDIYPHACSLTGTRLQHLISGCTKVTKTRPITWMSAAHHLKHLCNSSWKLPSETQTSHIKKTSYFSYSELIRCLLNGTLQIAHYACGFKE